MNSNYLLIMYKEMWRTTKKEYFEEFSEKELQLIKNLVFSDLEFGEEDANLASSLENQLDYVGRRLSTNTSVPGNIHRPRFREFWEKELEAPEFVVETLASGYSLPFTETPPPVSKETTRVPGRTCSLSGRR